MEIQEDEFIFSLGALIYPKEMIKMQKNNQVVLYQVMKIYNYLYKFSLERLQKLINNKSLIFLFGNYLEKNNFSRVSKSENMTKYQKAYLEACKIMIHQSIY
jgi:hypothetical protein